MVVKATFMSLVLKLCNDTDLCSDDHGTIAFEAFTESTARAMVAASDGKVFETGAARTGALETSTRNTTNFVKMRLT